jgi:hypothetical protein
MHHDIQVDVSIELISAGTVRIPPGNPAFCYEKQERKPES